MLNCDKCDKPAIVHEVTVRNGVKKELHLCIDHAREAGIEITAPQPINQLLTQFQVQKVASREKKSAALTCRNCGMTFAEFRRHSVLGCPECYVAFDSQLSPLIERSQGNATHHVGKTPQRAGGSIDQQRLIQQIVRELDEAVAAEQYERAAKLRDRLRNIKTDDPPIPQTTVRKARRTSSSEMRES